MSEKQIINKNMEGSVYYYQRGIVRIGWTSEIEAMIISDYHRRISDTQERKLRRTTNIGNSDYIEKLRREIAIERDFGKMILVRPNYNSSLSIEDIELIAQESGTSLQNVRAFEAIEDIIYELAQKHHISQHISVRPSFNERTALVLIDKTNLKRSDIISFDSELNMSLRFNSTNNKEIEIFNEASASKCSASVCQIYKNRYIKMVTF